MVRSIKSAVAFSSMIVLAVACSKGKGGGGGGGGGGEAPAADAPPAEAGTVAIDTTPPADDGKTESGGTKIPDDLARTDVQESMSQQIPLRPALLIGTVAISLTELTEFDQFEEGKFVWNPAQIPLNELNKIVCVLAKTGFNWHADKDTYIAKVNLDECFSAKDAVGGDMGEQKASLPSDVTLKVAANAAGEISLKVWFSRSMKSGDTRGMNDVMIWKPYNTLDLDYYVYATMKEIPTIKNPFGQFDMRWELQVKVNGTLDPYPYQEGYVTTAKASEGISLKYNQMNYDYNSVQCSDIASAEYRGVRFDAASSGASANGVTLAFDGLKTVNDVLASLPVQVNIQSFGNVVLPAGTVTLTDGTDQGLAYVDIDGIRFTSGNDSQGSNVDVWSGDRVSDVIARNSAFQLSVPGGTDESTVLDSAAAGYHKLQPDYATGAKASYYGLNFDLNMTGTQGNGKSLQFDGVKTLEQVRQDFEKSYPGFNVMVTGGGGLILPAGAVTLQGGYDSSPATATVNTNNGPVVISSIAPGRGGALNGTRFYFDGVQTLSDVLNKSGKTADVMVTSGDMMSVPLEGFVTLTGGSGPPSEIGAIVREFAANATMDLVSGKPVRGKAHTAENWSQKRITTHCPNKTHTFDPQPVSYGMAFDREDQGKPSSSNPYPGRAALKMFSDYVYSGARQGFDPGAVRCDQMGGEFANVWNYALFTPDGKQLDYKTDFPLYLEGSDNAWGNGWVSQWGISIWSATVKNGDRAYIKNQDGSKRWFTITRFNGSLRDDMWTPVSGDSGTLALTCDSGCPAGELTQSLLDNRYDISTFLYGQEYLYDFATKKLYRDIDKDGGMDVEIKIAAGATGWFSIDLKSKSDPTKTYRYDMNSYSPEIGLKEGSTFFTPPRPIAFDGSRVYNEDDAYPGSGDLNSAHNGKAFSDLISGGGKGGGGEGTLTYAYGNLCCFDWEQKNGIFDEWGNNVYGPKVTLRKGTELTVVGDPDGSGPIKPGMKIRLAPSFTELKPITKSDCSTGLENTVTAIESDMPLPQPLTKSSDRDISTLIGNRPDGRWPVLVINGENVAP